MNILQKDDDKTLISKLQNDEVKAFDALFLKYSEKLFRFSFSLLKNEEDSKGIVQEVFLRIWKKRKEIDTSKSFKSFLFAISYNLIVDQLRLRLKDKKYQEYLTRYFETENLDLRNEFDYAILVDKVRNAVENLPAKRKQIYILSREVGLPHKEIAGKLGISVKTVENQITLALKHLKSNLGRDVLPAILFLSLFA
ncbi:MAG: RNA polymerase sigma-70 factor [Draconibacterium sp.]|nr:RNA polymerase sigma-70 factor [Draconibacterium sp.]